MIIFINALLTIFAIIYLSQIIRFYIGLFRLNRCTNHHLFSTSIIIPARNEADQIDKCLASLIVQNYPKEKIEIIVVNDNSTDATESIVRKFSTNHDHIKLIALAESHPILSPKKHAITSGIQSSQNELIFTTDADCFAHPDWLRTMVSCFESDVGMVTGLVILNKTDEQTLFHKVQSLEFLSLVLAGAGSIGFDVPIIANGANLAYRRSVFDEVNGFSGIETLRSGDDDLLIQKIARLTSWKIKCATELSSIISTKPVPSLKAFINQRIRWASKGIHYHNPLFVLYLISVYFFYLLLFCAVPFSILNWQKFPLPAIVLSIKMLFDFIFLIKSTTMVHRRDLLKYFPLAELFQIPYILVVGFLGLWGKYRWKGR